VVKDRDKARVPKMSRDRVTRAPIRVLRAAVVRAILVYPV
jgi:hypothetical protein